MRWQPRAWTRSTFPGLATEQPKMTRRPASTHQRALDAIDVRFIGLNVKVNCVVLRGEI